MIFYSVLTWYIGPMAIERLQGSSDRAKQAGFVAGFATSMALYNVVGRAYIAGEGDY